MNNKFGYFMLTVLFFTCAATLPMALSSKSKKADYSILEGTWVDLQSNEFNGIAALFKPNGEYMEFLFYNKEEKLMPGARPESLVWTGYGTYGVSQDVLLIKITGTSDNMTPFNKSFHFVRLEKTEMELLNTVGGKRTTWKKLK